MENVGVTVPKYQKCLDAQSSLCSNRMPHFTFNDVFCATKIPVRKEHIRKMEKEKNEISSGIAIADQAKKILETGKPINGMIGQELMCC